MKKSSEVKFDKLEKIVPNETTLEKEIFVKAEEVPKMKDLYFRKLEKKYSDMNSQIGYIETTSVCPYHCIMCPKNTHHIIRKYKDMSEENFERLVSQLDFQTEVELHLFGDPFCDKAIYERIQKLNNKGIVPSFSTNLVSISNINFEKLRMLKIGKLTISCDTDNYEIFSKIRGNITEEKLKKCYSCIEELADFAKRTNCIGIILLQKIKMDNNQESEMKIQRIAESNLNCAYVEKEYIEFPNEKRTGLGKRTEFTGSEKVLLYYLLGKRTPFKCLKVWDKKEQAVTSDGLIVPCCLSYNAVTSLGNINEQTLKEIQNSDANSIFRKSIWDGENTNYLCDSCFQNRQLMYHSKVDEQLIKNLRDFCIESW